MDFVPTPRQVEAITYPSRPILIIAGAGTGKTSTLILRIDHKINAEVWEPEHIVVLTFTERSAEELKIKIRERIGNRVEGMAISTFHSFCDRLVREYSPSPDAEKLLIKDEDIIFLLLDRFDTLTFLSSRSFKADPVKTVRRSFVPFLSRLRDELLSAREIESQLAEFESMQKPLPKQFPGLSEKTDPEEILRQFKDLIQVYRSYQDLKRELKVVDYGDMILDCWEMLKGDPAILDKVRKDCRHIIIDEYQDNNYALNRIATLIAGDEPDLTVVGDEDQCIYSFRGANYHNVRDFRQKYGVTKNKGETALEENHRSTREILNLANVSISHDTHRTPKTLVSATGRHGPKPVWHVGTRLQTLGEIPRLVKKLVNEEREYYGDIALLCRSRNHVKAVAESLQRASIPTEVFVERFFSVPAVRTLLAWGHLICGDSRSEMALFRILHEYVSRSFAERISQALHEDEGDDVIGYLKSVASNDGLSPMERHRLGWVLHVIHILRRELKQKWQADEMVWEILRTTDLLHETRSSYRYRDRLALANVGHLLSLAESFAAREDRNTLNRWLRYMKALAIDGSQPAVQPEFHDTSVAVKVMTIHKSKGMEFPVVIIPFLRASSFPTNYTPAPLIDHLPDTWYNWPRPKDLSPKEEHLNEERRIFYVAVTRAKDELHLFGPEKAQSLFLKEILNQEKTYVRRKEMGKSRAMTKKRNHSELKQKLLVELNRELAGHQYANAHTIIEGMRILEQDGELPEDHAYARLTADIPTDTHEDSFDIGEPLTLSASSVEEYNRCPYKYRLGKVDRVPERKSRVQMEFGIIIHDVLQEFHGSRDQGLEFLLALLDKHWKKEAFEYLIREEEFKRQGIQMLKDYFEFLQSNQPSVVAREAFFDFKISDLNVRILGKIDRVDREGNKLAVIDYKTSKIKEKANRNLQLALYTEAIQRNVVEGVMGRPGSARLHFLRHPDDPIESHTFSEEDLEKQFKKIKQVSEGIRRREFEPKTGWHCDYCDYRDFLCPAWEEE